MFSLSHVIKGILIGAACVLPGISGAALALSMGIYETILGAVSHLLQSPKKSLQTLAPFLLGCLLALTGFTYAAEYLLSNYPYPFAMTVGGFLFGGIPFLWHSFKASPHQPRQRKAGAALFLFFFFLTLFFSAVQPPMHVGKPLSLRVGTLLITFCLGLLYSITMIVPGVSGSLLLMMFGYYYSLIETAKQFFEGIRTWQLSQFLPTGLMLLPFFAGLFLGGYCLSSCVTWLFEAHRFFTFASVLGIIASSLFTIFHHMGIFTLLPTLGTMQLLCGILLFFGGSILSFQLGEKPE